MRTPWPAVAAGVAALLIGGAGAVRGSMPQAVPAAPSSSSTAAAPIVVADPYVRQPVHGATTAAAYFTIYNTTGKPDRLVSVTSGAGATAVLHAYVHGRMTAARNGVVIPAHGSLTLRTGQGHVMIQQLFGSLTVGSSVDLQLTFSRAGTIDVTAPVIGLTAAPPTGGPSSSSSGAGK